MRTTYDVIVVGLGGIGSAALYWLARRLGGENVLGIEQFALSHPYGASQDHSRIIRLAYDDPAYARLMPFAYAHWQEVEAESGLELVVDTGGLVITPGEGHGSEDVDRYAAAMRTAGVPYELWSAEDVQRRFPQFRLHPADRAVYGAQAGLVNPGKANAVHQVLARARGATLLSETPVQNLSIAGGDVVVETAAGTFSAGHLVLACGAWTNKLLAHLGQSLPLTVTEEQVTYFATPHLREFSPQRFPIWIWHGDFGFYGFPVYGEVATKAGQDVGGDVVTVDNRKLQPNPRPLANLQQFLGERIPHFLGPVLYTKPCLYTMPPDRGFILDHLPGYPQVSLAVGAGHGYKFAALLGRILSDLALDGETVFDISVMSAAREAVVTGRAPADAHVGGSAAVPPA